VEEGLQGDIRGENAVELAETCLVGLGWQW